MIRDMLMAAAGASSGPIVLPDPVFISSSIVSTVGNQASIVIPAPAGIQNGDLLVGVYFLADASLTAMASRPAGFAAAAVSNQPLTNTAHAICAKTALNESGSYTFTLSSNKTWSMALLLYRNAKFIQFGSSINTPSAPSLYARNRGTLVTAYAARTAGFTIATPPAGMTSRAFINSNAVPFAVYDLAAQAVGDTGVKTVVWSTPSGNKQSISFQIFNAAPSGEMPLQIADMRQVNGIGVPVVTLEVPFGTEAGDLMVAIPMSSYSNYYTTAVPAGFEIMQRGSTVPTEGGSSSIASKIVTSEVAGTSLSFTVSSDAETTNGLLLMVFRNATRVNIVGQSAALTGTSIAAPSITPKKQGVLLGRYRMGQSGGSVAAPTGMGLVARLSFLGALYEASFETFSQNYDTPDVPTGTRTITSNGGPLTLDASLFLVSKEQDILPVFVAEESVQNLSGVQTLVIPIPAGVIAGDILIAQLQVNGGFAWNAPASPDFIPLANQGAVQPTLYIAYRTATGSEPVSYTFTNTSATRLLGGTIAAYRHGAIGVAGNFASSQSSLQLPSVTSEKSQSLLFAAAAANASNIVIQPATGMAIVARDSGGQAPSWILCSQSMSEGPTAIRKIDVGNNNDAGLLFTINPTRG